jgi:hypothetical protein
LTVPNEPGIQRASWDLRYESPVPAAQLGEGQRRGGRGIAMRGPRVLPGEYLVRLSLNGKEMVKSLIVEEDTRIEITTADAEARLKIMLAINRLQKSGFDAQRMLDNLRTQLNSVEENLKKQANVPQAVRSAVDSLTQEVRAVRAGLAPQQRGPNQQESAGPPDPGQANAVMTRISRLFGELDSYTEPAVPRHQEELKKYTLQLNELIGRVNKIITESVPNLNKLIAESGMSPIKAGETIAPLQ